MNFMQMPGLTTSRQGWHEMCPSSRASSTTTSMPAPSSGLRGAGHGSSRCDVLGEMCPSSHLFLT